MYSVFFFFFSVKPFNDLSAVDDGNVRELEKLRDRYEGRLTVLLYAAIFVVAAVTTFVALVVLCILHYTVSDISF